MRLRFREGIQLLSSYDWLTTAAPRPSNASKPSAAPRGAQRPLFDALPQQLLRDLQRPEVMLVPLRGFIGLGWLRAGVEKAVDPGWASGASLTTFLHQQLGHVAFPAYHTLITAAFLPHVVVLSWIIMFGQLLAGVAIALGFLTRPALIGGLFMNTNFLLAGVPNPSAFYLVIQGTLLMANTGRVLGVDGLLSRRAALRHDAPAEFPALGRRRRWLRVVALVLFAGVAGVAAPFIRDLSPAGSVHDPAMLVVIVSLMAAVWSVLSYLSVVTSVRIVKE